MTHLDTRTLRDQLHLALAALPTDVGQVLALRHGLGNRGQLSPQVIAKRIGISRARVVALEVSGIRKLRRPTRSRPLFGALDRLNPEIWDAVAQPISEAGSLLYKDSPLDTALRQLPGEVQLVLECKYGDLSSWLAAYASATEIAWFRAARPDAVTIEAVGRVGEIEAQDRLPMPVAKIFQTLGCDLPNLQFILALCRLDLAVYDRRYVARQPLPSDSLRAIRIHLQIAKNAPRALSLPEIVRGYNQSYRDDQVTDAIAQGCFRAKEHLFQRSGEAWALVDADAESGDFDGLDGDARFHFNRRWEETTAVDLIKEVLGAVDSAGRDDVIKCVVERSNQRCLVPAIAAALVSSEGIVSVAPTRFALQQACAGLDPVLATSSLLLNRKDCKRFIVDRYAGEPLQSYPLWTPAMEREWCCWAERNTGIGFGGESSRSFNRKLYQSVLFVADPTRWPVGDAERKVWEFKKACHGAYHFADGIDDTVWENPPTLQDLFSAADLARRCGYLNWIHVNRALACEDHSPKAVPTLAFLVVLGLGSPAEHWQAKHALGPRLEEGLDTMVMEIRKKGFLHWRDPAGVALRRQLGTSAGTSFQLAGWVEYLHVRQLQAALDGRTVSMEEEGKGALPAAGVESAPLCVDGRPRQFELPF